MVGDNWETATVVIGGIATLAIFSFLIRENPFFRVFEHIFIGIATGLTVVVGLKSSLWQTILIPVLGLDIAVFPDGSQSKPYDPLNLLYLFPLLFGLLYYCIYSKRYYWLAKLVIGFSLGASAGLAFQGFFSLILPQLSSSFRPFAVWNESGEFLFWKSAENIFFVVTLLSVMYYFFFSFKRQGEASRVASGTGRWLLMICFGAFFGSTVMARMALLVERLQFLLNEWPRALARLFWGA